MELKARIQRMNECSAEGMRMLCASLVREGCLSDGAEGEGSLSEEERADLDSEIDLRDEDEYTAESSSTETLAEDAIRADGLDSGGLPIGNKSLFTLQVMEETCRFVVPHWFSFQDPGSETNEWLKAAHQKFDSLERFALWVTSHRSEFLRTADPWDLGCKALEELQNGTPSTTEAGLTNLAGIEGQWNRHQRDAYIVWEDGELPLGFFTGKNAKLAWAAQALTQFHKKENIAIPAEILDQSEGITKPKTKRETANLRMGPLQSLGADELIARICVVAGVNWDEVLAAHRHRILQSFQSS